MKRRKLYLPLTVNALKENVEDAVAWDGELVLVEKVVLNALLVVLRTIEVVLLQVVHEAGGDGPDALYVHGRRRKLLLAVLN